MKKLDFVTTKRSLFTNEATILIDAQNFPTAINNKTIMLNDVMEQAETDGITIENLQTIKFSKNLLKLEGNAIKFNLDSYTEDEMASFELDFEDCNSVVFNQDAVQKVYIEELHIPEHSCVNGRAFTNCEIDRLIIGKGTVLKKSAFFWCTIREIILEDDCTIESFWTVPSYSFSEGIADINYYQYCKGKTMNLLQIGKNAKIQDEEKVIRKPTLDDKIEEYFPVISGFLYHFKSESQFYLKFQIARMFPGEEEWSLTKNFDISDHFSKEICNMIEGQQAFLLDCLSIPPRKQMKEFQTSTVDYGDTRNAIALETKEFENIAIFYSDDTKYKQINEFENYDWKNVYITSKVSQIDFDDLGNSQVATAFYAPECPKINLINEQKDENFSMKGTLYVGESCSLEAEKDIMGFKIEKIEKEPTDIQPVKNTLIIFRR